MHLHSCSIAMLSRRRKSQEGPRAIIAYRLADGPYCADVDSLDVAQGQHAAQDCGDDDEDAGAEEHANGNLTPKRDFNLPKKRNRDTEDDEVGPGGHVACQHKGLDAGDRRETLHCSRHIEDHKSQIVCHGECTLV